MLVLAAVGTTVAPSAAATLTMRDSPHAITVGKDVTWSGQQLNYRGPSARGVARRACHARGCRRGLVTLYASTARARVRRIYAALGKRAF